MDKTTGLSVSKVTVLYTLLLYLYPADYRKKFAEQMVYVFEDMLKTEIQKSQKVRFSFWLKICADTFVSAFWEHIDEINKKGVKKYFNLHFYNVIPLMLMMPFFSLFLIDLVSRFAQGDLVHYNRQTYSYLSHTFLYQNHFLLFCVMILFPLLALLLAGSSVLIKILVAKKRPSQLFDDPLSLFMLLSGLSALLIVIGHDFFPCFIKLVIGHRNTFADIIGICRRA